MRTIAANVILTKVASATQNLNRAKFIEFVVLVKRVCDSPLFCPRPTNAQFWKCFWHLPIGSTRWFTCYQVNARLLPSEKSLSRVAMNRPTIIGVGRLPLLSL